MEAGSTILRTRDGVRLACADFGGAGPPILLLHGLAGHAGEWAETASWLAISGRVLAPDQRGHGGSERRPGDVSRDAYVRDAAMWIEAVAGGPATVIGQSLGAHTAFLLAARRPELVQGLVVAEATPGQDPEAPGRVAAWLARWPRPFPTHDAALRFFGGDSLRARAWMDGLEQRADGLWSRFDSDVMVATLDEVARNAYWDEWAAVRCPTLVVRSERGVPRTAVVRMCELLPRASQVEIEGAGHDLHLERPDCWRQVIERFLAEIDEAGRR